MYSVFITGVGYSLCYITTSVVIQSHFDVNRALATGCALMGCSIGNVIAPSLITYLIEIYGWRGSMLIMAAILAHIIAFGALIKTPPRPGHNSNPVYDDEVGQDGNLYKPDERVTVTTVQRVSDVAAPDAPEIPQSGDTAMPQSEDTALIHSEDTKMTNSEVIEMPHSEDISLIHSEESEKDNSICKEITRSDDTKMTYSDVRELPYSELVLSLVTDRTQGEDTQKTQSEVTVGVSYEWKDTAVIENDRSDIACVGSNGTYVGSNGSYVSGTVTTKVTEPTRGNIVGAKSFLNDVFDFGLLKNYVFLLVCICSMMSLYNQYTYIQHMPSKAVVLGHSKDEAAFLVSVFCTAAITSRIVVTLVANARCVNRTMLFACGIMLGGVAAYLTLLHGMVGLSVASVTYGVHIGEYQ